jgi:tetratricopeptide (TPR) repeat protein
MTSSSPKTLSPAELAKLEHAFATDPASDAYRALAEAYLGLGRFMEAMVVCKKGVKAHPTSPLPRLLLSRVYAEQGKDKKALEEAQGALQVAPADTATLRTVAALQLKTGEGEAGRATLLQAHAADPSDAETLSLMAQHGVAVPAPAAPAAAPAPAAAAVAAAPGAAAPRLTPVPLAPGVPVLHPAGAPQGRPAPAPAPLPAPGEPSVLELGAPVYTPAPAGSVVPRGAARPQGGGAPAAPAAPSARPAGARPAAAARPPAPVDEDEDEAPARARRKSGGKGQRLVFFSLLVAVPLAVTGYNWQNTQARTRLVTVGKYLNESEEQLKHDSFDSYQKACKAAEAALEVDPESVRAHGFLAYAYTIRWAEHGGGTDARDRAERHLAEAKKAAGTTELSSHLLAAEALFQMASGKGAEALAALSARISSLEAQKKQSSLLYITQGLLLTGAGELDKAREALQTAQALAPADPRVYSALGTLYRRRGQDALSEQNFDFALRYEKNHPESLLGKVLLGLQAEAPDYAATAGLLQKLTDASPPPSPRQLATAQLARSLLIGRVLQALPSMEAAEQKKVLEAAGIPADRARAEAELEKAEQQGLATDGTNPELHLIRGRRLLLAGQVDAAAEAIRAAVKLEPTRAQLHLELARTLMRKAGGEAEAVEALRTAVKSMGESPKLLLLLGDALRRQGKLDDAIAQYGKAVGAPADPKAPRAPEARIALGTAFREKRELARAQEELEKAVGELLGKPALQAQAFMELARVLAERGEGPKADDAFKRALETDAEYAPSYVHYARFMSGDRRQANRVRLLAQEYLKRAPRGDLAAEARQLAQ